MSDGFVSQDLLDRAIAAELQLKSRSEELEAVQETLKALLVGDISETAAGSWVARAEHAERLLGELVRWIGDNPSVETLLPIGYASRVRAQLHTLEILHRDQEALGEKPPPGSVLQFIAPLQGQDDIVDALTRDVTERMRYAVRIREDNLKLVTKHTV